MDTYAHARASLMVGSPRSRELKSKHTHSWSWDESEEDQTNDLAASLEWRLPEWGYFSCHPHLNIVTSPCRWQFQAYFWFEELLFILFLPLAFISSLSLSPVSSLSSGPFLFQVLLYFRVACVCALLVPTRCFPSVWIIIVHSSAPPHPSINRHE